MINIPDLLSVSPSSLLTSIIKCAPFLSFHTSHSITRATFSLGEHYNCWFSWLILKKLIAGLCHSVHNTCTLSPAAALALMWGQSCPNLDSLWLVCKMNAVKVSRQQSTAVTSIPLAAHRERAYFLLICPLNLNIQFPYTSPSPLLWFFSLLALCYWIYFSFGLLLKSSVSTHLTHQESGWLSLHLNPILNANECFVKKKTIIFYLPCLLFTAL